MRVTDCPLSDKDFVLANHPKSEEARARLRESVKANMLFEHLDDVSWGV